MVFSILKHHINLLYELFKIEKGINEIIWPLQDSILVFPIINILTTSESSFIIQINSKKIKSQEINNIIGSEIGENISLRLDPLSNDIFLYGKGISNNLNIFYNNIKNIEPYSRIVVYSKSAIRVRTELITEKLNVIVSLISLLQSYLQLYYAFLANKIFRNYHQEVDKNPLNSRITLKINENSKSIPQYFLISPYFSATIILNIKLMIFEPQATCYLISQRIYNE